MFIARRQDGTIYGMWTVRQFEGQEELHDDHPDVIAGPVKLPPQTPEEVRLATDETEQGAVKADNQVQTFLNMTPAQLDTWVANNIEAGALTLAQVKTNTGTAFRVLGRIALAAGRGRTLR